MKNKPLLSFLISRGAIIYTCCSGIYFIISLLVENSKPLEPKQFIFLLLFSYILAAGSAVYRCEGISRIARRCWHAVLFIGGFTLFLALCSVTFKLVMIATLIFAIVYTAIAIVSEIKLSRGVTKAPKQKKEASKEAPKKAKVEYQSIFSKPDDQKDGRR